MAPAGSISSTTVQAALQELDGDIATAAELVASDPAELNINPVGNVATLTLLSAIDRRADVHAIGQYYFNALTDGWGRGALANQNILNFYPVRLSAGTIDRIGVEVTTAATGGEVRCGVYSDNGGMPGNLIAEASGTGNASTIGTKDLTISAVLPKNGRYWLATVAQNAATIQLRNFLRGQPVLLPQGTTAPTGQDPKLCRIASPVTGPLPLTPAISPNANSFGARIHYRYSALT